MEQYDVVIIGGSTTGSYFARRCAEKGFRVLIIEKSKRDKISPDYDIFHMDKADLKGFGLPEPAEGAAEFEFEDGTAFSAFGNYPKPSKYRIVGMHKHAYILQLNDWAKEAGAEIIYEASFTDFTYDENIRINGITYSDKDGKTVSVGCRLAADCSGIPSAARRALPDGYGVENFEIMPKDLFYVTLRYIKFADEQPLWRHSDSWLFYKSWISPSDKGSDAILGIGGSFGFDYVEKMFDMFTKNVKLPAYTVDRIEKGCTPYRRPPYSFVADGFIAMGDAACLTRPYSGEGCASSMVQADIAVDVIADVMKDGNYPTRQALWSINKRYIEVQGKEYAGLLAMLIGAIRHSADANEFFFKHDIIFSQKIFSGMEGGVKFTVPDYVKMVFFIIVGLVTGKIRLCEIKSIINGALNGGKVAALYAEFPSTPDGFEEWVKKAEALWGKIGGMSDWKLL